MESDDDYESFFSVNNEPSPSPKHRRLKRLRKSAIEPNQLEATESVSELLGLPKVDFAKLEALESSDIKAYDHDSIPRSLELEDSLDNDDDGRKEKELSSCFDDTDNTHGDIDQKESKADLEFEEGFDDDDDDSSRKEKDLRSYFDDTRVDNEQKESETDLDCEEGFDDDDVMEKKLRTDRKETKRALEFEDDISENIESTDVKIRDDEVNEKKRKKKRAERPGEDLKAKTSVRNKRREAKERRAHLEHLHAESQRLLRETRGVSFKAVPLVQKPISSILERIRQRKLEVSKKFSQSNIDDLDKEDDGCVEQDVMDHSKSVETECGDLSESGKEVRVSIPNEDPEPDDVGMGVPDACTKRKRHDNASSQMGLDEEPKPVLRAPVDDTQELFGDSQTSDSKESENEEPCENTTSSHEEEMGPSLLAMKLKFDSALDDDISDEEENDKENVAPHFQPHSSPTGDPVKAFVDVEAEEEDDSDNDRMQFGDDDDDEEEDDDDTEELNKMIATGYKERPIDLETRNELHQKWLEEKDAAGTDDLLRRLNVTSKLRDASLLDDEEEEEEGEDDVDINNDVEEDVERPRVGRIDSKTAKELIAQMFTDKDDDFLSSDDEEIEKILVRERLRNKAGDKGKLVSPLEDEVSSEVFGLIKKLNTVPEVRKKAKTTSFFDTMLTGGNSNSSSKSSFLSRASSHSFSSSSKQGQGRSTGARSFIFGRDDSNSRSSISVSEDISDTTTSREIQTKKVTTKYSSSQSQARSSTQTTKLVTEKNSTTSFFEILKHASVQSNVKKQNHEVDISQSAFAAFKIPKKPVKIHGRV